MAEHTDDNSFKGKLTQFLSLDTARIESLREILQREQQREVSLEEAQAVGEGLINLYRHLAGDRKITGIRPEKEGG